MYITAIMYIRSMSQRPSKAKIGSQLTAVVGQGEAGVTVEPSRRAPPVAVVPPSSLRGKRSQFQDAYRVFLAKFPLDETGLENEFDSIRDKTPGRQVSL